MAKKPEWLKLEYQPNQDLSAVTEGNVVLIPTKRNVTGPAQASGSSNTANVNIDTLPHGTRVIITVKDGRKVNGAVRWTGELPLEGEDPKMKIPVYGVETVSFIVKNCRHMIICM